MKGGVRAKKISPNQPKFYAFLNSTIALLMALAGFVVHDLLIARGALSFYSLICFIAVVFNFSLLYLWARFLVFKSPEWLLFAVMGIEWCWVVHSISGLYLTPHHLFSFGLSLITALIIWQIYQLSSGKWMSTAAFSIFGAVALGLTVWQGLEDWSISATAKLHLKSGKSPMVAETLTTGGSHPISNDGFREAWSYAGETGPSMWGQLRPEFSQCSSGLHQSPIDIPRHAFLTRQWVRTHWGKELGTVASDRQFFKVDLSGKVRFDVDRKSFRAKEIHLHSPSEHQLSGLSYPMEIQMILETGRGEKIAVAAFAEIGSENPEFGKILSKLNSGGSGAIQSIDNLAVSHLFPSDFSAYRYQGSMTVPPCTEGYAWSILRKPIELSAHQIAAFRKHFPPNSRPIQPFNGRKFEVSLPPLAH